MANAATSCARAAISAVGYVPSHILDFFLGSRISDTHFPQFLFRTPRKVGCLSSPSIFRLFLLPPLLSCFGLFLGFKELLLVAQLLEAEEGEELELPESAGCETAEEEVEAAAVVGADEK